MSATAESQIIANARRQPFVAGQWLESDRHYRVENPATGEELCRVGVTEPGDVRAAVDAACAAQGAWARTPARERSDILMSVFEDIRAHGDELATLISLESGKTLADARGEITYGNEFLRWYAEEAVRPEGYYGMAPSGDKRVLTTVGPVGPCLLITPWNFPLAMLTRKVGPALAAGCTALVKPAGQTPLTALLLADMFARAGLPEGVLSVLTTDSSATVVDPLLDDARIRKLSFTGSTEVGRLLAGRAGSALIKTSMELGGNAPFLVFDDADLERAVASAVLAKLRNAGQSCIAANRFLVQDGIAERFVSRFAEELQRQRLGAGTETGIDMGPLIDGRSRDRVLDLVQAAKVGGAQVLCGGVAPERPGFFIQPTLLAEVPADAPILSEEVFGPVAPVVTFGDEDEAVAIANDTHWGLVSYVHTGDLDRALRLGDDLEAGMVGVNRGVVSEVSAPFGGTGASGLGREGGPQGLREYQELKYMAVDIAEA